MISALLGFLDKIKLSITQWLLLSSGAAIGVLVIMLKLQGNKVHQLQVKLLESSFKTSDEIYKSKLKASQESVSQKKAVFERELALYNSKLKSVQKSSS